MPALAAKIVSALIRFARWIGRWLVRRLARVGALSLAGYMDGKIEDFKRRLAGVAKFTTRAAKRRWRWLTGRIARWTAALEWLTEHSGKIEKAAVRAFDKLDERIRALPMVSKYETDPTGSLPLAA